MKSKYRFIETYANNNQPTSKIYGTLIIEHNLSEEEIEYILDEYGLYLDDVEGINYFSMDWDNEAYGIEFVKIGNDKQL